MPELIPQGNLEIILVPVITLGIGDVSHLLHIHEISPIGSIEVALAGVAYASDVELLPGIGEIGTLDASISVIAN